jgi:hypothetical protein
MKRMPILLALVLTSCLFAKTADAGNGLTAISGTIDYIHDAPQFEGLCNDPVPGVELSVRGVYDVTVNGTPFFGVGPARTCVFDKPLFGIFAKYSGEFEWTSPTTGQTLSGKYVGIDTDPVLLVPGSEVFVSFKTVIFVTFTDADGNFAGAATAKGVDIPFSDPTTGTPPGVYASFEGFLIGDND